MKLTGAVKRPQLQGCVGTFRWQHINLPLSEDSSFSTGQGATGGGESIISVKQARGVSIGCSQRTTCATVGFAYCGGSYVCVDFWKGPFCTCPVGAQALLGPDGQLAGCGATLAVSSLGISSPAVILILTCLILLIRKYFSVEICFKAFSEEIVNGRVTHARRI